MHLPGRTTFRCECHTGFRIALVILASMLAPGPARAAGFVQSIHADSLDSPVSMAFAPDGRLFVCEQGGALRVIKHGRLLRRPFVTLPVHAEMEEGLLAVAFDPEFARTRWVYLNWTTREPVRRQRIERWTASGDTALSGSAVTIAELDPHLAHVHVGGAMRFGPDGKLWVGTGENDRSELSQSLRSTFGKLLRLERDGSIPADNPFATVARGLYRAIVARGLRNVIAFDFEPGTHRLLLDDVGGSEFEEVNDVTAGGNYGWPIFEGPRGVEEYRRPLHAYAHARGCAITGGVFATRGFLGPDRAGERKWLFTDYCLNELRAFTIASPDSARTLLVTRRPGPVDLRFGPDGALYCLVRGNSQPVGGAHMPGGAVIRISRR